MKKVKGIFSKSVIESANKLNDALADLGAEMMKVTKPTKYLRWKTTFKPQSQKIINVIIITVIVLAMAEIVWFWLTKY